MRIQKFSENEGSRLLEIVAEKLREVGPERCALLFDFDGVLSSKQEDRIYRLSVTPEETERLKNLSTFWNMNRRRSPTPGVSVLQSTGLRLIL
jgi:hypothetical protein